MIGGQQGLSAPAAYRAVEGISADPEELMKMALDGARAKLLQAEAAIAAGDQPAKAAALSAASDIIQFLLGLSGIERGELSDRLAEAYRYAMMAIVVANAGDDAEAAMAGRTVIEQLAAVWRNTFPDAAE
jgi:flagellar biosynthetic protein FliS